MRTLTTNPLHAPKTAVQNLYTEQDALALIRAKRDAGKSLRAIASEYGSPVNHADIERALQGRFPHSLAKRNALKLLPVCPECDQPIRRRRVVPGWVQQATQNLRELETKADKKPNPVRTYSRQGRRVI
jgi:hypothetical protein